MENNLTFQLSEKEIAKAGCVGFPRALLCLLASRTSTLWRLSGISEAVEIMAPYRVARLWVEEEGEWRPYCGAVGSIGSFRFEIGTSGSCTSNTALTLAQGEWDESQEGVAQMAYQFFRTRNAEARAGVPTRR